MDEYSGKRATDRLAARKSPGLVLKDTAKCGYQKSQDCSRLSCSSRSTSSKAPTVSFLEKTKSIKTSTNGKEIVGSSSRTATTVGNSKKTISESRRKLISQSRSEAPESENGSIEDEKDGSDPVPPGKIRRAHSRNRDFMDVGSSSSASNSGSSASTGATNSSSAASGTGPNRYALRNLKCNSSSDLVQSGSASNRNHNGTKVILKKTNSERESSSISREMKMNKLLPNINSGHGLSISDSRRTRSTASQTQNGVSSAPSRSSVNANTRTRLSMEPSHESSAMGRPMSQRNVSINGNALRSSGQFSTEPTSRRPFSSTRVRNSNGNSIRPTSPVELSSTLSLDNLHHYNIDGVAEVLLALESIEQDEELTYELILLESRLFLNSITFYDQHRDMRLDIDGMSYEELLALEDRMGSVSTALTEEALSRCLARSIFDSNHCGDRGCSGDKNTVKCCCICQEEYVNGDEIGRLECKHWFHEGCIQQWLRQKNWCPICKASAELPGRRPSPPPS